MRSFTPRLLRALRTSPNALRPHQLRSLSSEAPPKKGPTPPRQIPTHTKSGIPRDADHGFFDRESEVIWDEDLPKPAPVPEGPVPETTGETIFSGIQPTGVPHLGNYLGALKQWSRLQETNPDAKLIYCLVDLHAITKPQDPEQLRRWKKESLATLLASGVDPKKATIFEQSRVPEHSELQWIFSTLIGIGPLSRMTQWKLNLVEAHTDLIIYGKSKEDLDNPSLKLGLLSYPVLQAADILVHRATAVPVGEDQCQHLELARDIARIFNHNYGATFPLPKTLLSPAKRIMSLTNPLQKMSKSDPQEKSKIILTDSEQVIKKKFYKAVTDNFADMGIAIHPEQRPGLTNLINIYTHMEGLSRTPEEVAEEFRDISYKELKEKCIEVVNRELEPFRKEYARLMQEDAYLEEVVLEGSRQAKESAVATMNLVRKAVGLSFPV
ncbi:tryptophanyl-tRNA synthetase [Ascobolus immersus RN42]|uniref:Tryptophan--tRNA ligase, mitochondrial n=1 Tax=Ascobolus immersus RN42 TaxID=1160509 RepID=A0A3N4IMR7_ASCIM|nr:tryptophanyl-tRNA synthetase [Ascobolus immersus RN42]